MYEAVVPLLNIDVVQVTVPPGVTSVATGIVGYVLFAIGLRPVLVKSGRHGWGAFVPFYNTFLMEELAGLNGWLAILFYVPIVNLVMGIWVARGNGKAFGKGVGFSFWMLWVLPIIGYAILGFGKAQFMGDGGRPGRGHRPARNTAG